MSDAEALYAAAYVGDVKAVRHGSNLDRLDDAINPLGWTVLMVAASQGHGDVVDWLLDAGARPDIATDDGDRALSLAAARGHVEVVEILTGDERVDVDARDGSGWTALMSASLHGHARVVALLLARADLAVNMADADGRTALIWAASAGNQDVVRLLVADDRVAVGHAAADGVTAADAARDAGLDAVSEELECDRSDDRPDGTVLPGDIDTAPPAPRVPPTRPIREPAGEFGDV